MMQCLFSLYSMVHDVMNNRPDIILLLKTVRISFACVMNPLQLYEIEKIFKGTSNDTIPPRVKNTNKGTSNCSDETSGVNLKFNYGQSPNLGACDEFYSGIGYRSERETISLLNYIQSDLTNLHRLVVVSK